MTKGRPRKKPRNISGLRNQQPTYRPSPLPVADTQVQLPHSTASGSLSRAPSPGDEDTYLPDMHDLVNGELGSTINQDESEREQQDFYRCLDNEKFGKRLVKMVVEDDADYLPKRRRGGKILRGRPKTYAKGPDVMSKSERTRRRYQPSFKNQAKLDNFFLSSGSNVHSVMASQSQFDTVATAPEATSTSIPQRCQRDPEFEKPDIQSTED